MSRHDSAQVDDDQVERLFQQAKLMSADEQTPFLDRHCGHNQLLRRAVKDLLDAFRQAPHPDFHNVVLPDNAVVRSLDRESLPDTAPETTVDVGMSVGPYKILQELGEGGMGTVFMAEQTTPVNRRVALKIIKSGLNTSGVIARFEVERQALAMMDHPNIAKVLDAGSTRQGQPYFVMELIHGIPLTDYCNEQRLDVRERLGLFIRVCEAVAHAHQKAIIHRDLKPSNILVAEYDHYPVPKIIDFGVAKAVNQKLSDKTLFTHYGQIIGTVEYMSPEQSRLNQLDIDTRSDIYSLGVVLYELLSGTTPFDRKRLRSAAFEEMLRIIREEEPPTPSSRVTAGKSADSLARARNTRPNALSRHLMGDLDWITLKALSKERRDRYQTALSLSEDITRHLEDRPIEARRPSRIGRVTRFVRRNKLTVGFILAASVTAIFGVIALYGYARANKATADAMQSQLKQEQAEGLRRKAEQESALVRNRLEVQGQQQRRLNTLTHLISQSSVWRDASPERSMLLAAEAVQYSQRNDSLLLHRSTPGL